jgi:hypothetical protein
LDVIGRPSLHEASFNRTLTVNGSKVKSLADGQAAARSGCGFRDASRENSAGRIGRRMSRVEAAPPPTASGSSVGGSLA